MNYSKNRSKIPSYRLAFIDKKVDEFRRKNNLNAVPFDGVDFIMNSQKSASPKIKIRSTPHLKDNEFARTIFVRSENLYLISVNINQLYDKRNKRVKYPYTISPDRMLNFTALHEIGHIELEHTDLLDSDKDEETIRQEDLEADEFAARLLMPKEALISCNFISVPAVASAFMVSKTALMRRLTELGRHDLRKKEPVTLCPVCGNELDKVDNYCTDCGTDVRDNKNGILRLHTLFSSIGEFYARDTYERVIYRNYLMFSLIENRCTSVKCQHLLLPTSSYCNVCGCETDFNNRNFIQDWNAKQKMLSDQLDLETKLQNQYGELENLPGWKAFVCKLDLNFRHILDKSCAVIADDTLMICSHTHTKIDISSNELTKLTKSINRFAKQNGVSSIEVATPIDFNWNKKAQKLPEWLKTKQRTDIFSLSYSHRASKTTEPRSMEIKLAEVGMSIYDFIPRKAIASECW